MKISEERIVIVELDGELPVMTGENTPDFLPQQIHMRWHRGHKRHPSGTFTEVTWELPDGTVCRDDNTHNPKWWLTSASITGPQVRGGTVPGGIGYVSKKDRPELLQQLLDWHDPEKE